MPDTEKIKSILERIDPTINWKDLSVEIEVVKEPPFGIRMDPIDESVRICYPENVTDFDDFLVAFEQQKHLVCVPNMYDLDQILKRAETEPMAFDTETNSLSPFKPGAKVVAFSIAFENGDAWAFPLVPPFTSEQRGKIFLDFMLELLKTAKYLVMQNGIFDVAFVSHVHNDRIKPEEIHFKFDTIVGAHVWSGAGLAAYNLGALAKFFLGVKNWKEGPAAWLAEHFRLKKDRTFDRVPPYILLPYARNDALYTIQIFSKLKDLLTQDDLVEVYDQIQQKIVGVCFRMHQDGLYTDKFIIDYLHKMFQDKAQESLSIFHSIISDRMAIISRTDPDAVTEEMEVKLSNVNPDSPKQLSDIFFNVLGLPLLDRTKSGQGKTGTQLMLKIASFDPPLFAALLTYKKWGKFEGYLKNYVKFSAQPFGEFDSVHRVCCHSSFSPIGTRTGRLSSKNPNAQNTSVRSGLKRVFVPPDRSLAIESIYTYLRGVGMPTYLSDSLFNDFDDADISDDSEDSDDF